MEKMNKVHKIVLTGGPCSGKSTALSQIVERFSNDFIVYSLPEVATLTITSGVNIIPTNYKPEDHKHLTKLICKHQMNLESYFEKIARLQKKDVIIICDRGVMDNFAYCSKENKKYIITKSGWTYNYICNDRYDLIIHLVTAAIGAEKYYTLENNEARYETAEQARDIDGKIAKQWIGHPNITLINNNGQGFNAKMERVMNCIANEVGKKMPMFYKKYLLKEKPTFDFLKKNFEKVYEYVDTITFLLTNEKNRVKWLVRRQYEGNNFPTYFAVDRILAEKHEDRIETHQTISERVYFEFLDQQIPSNSQFKRETFTFLIHHLKDYLICFVENVIVDGKDNVSILRIKRDNKDLKSDYVPKILKVGEEITENPKYFSINLSKL